MKGYPLLRQLCLTLSVCPLKSCLTITVGCSVICTLGGFGSLPFCIFSGTVFSLSFSLWISEQAIREQILLKTYYYQRKDYTARWDREMSMKTLYNICLVMLWDWEWSLAQHSETHLWMVKQDYSDFCLLQPGMWLSWEAALINVSPLKTDLLRMGCLCGASKLVLEKATSTMREKCWSGLLLCHFPNLLRSRKNLSFHCTFAFLTLSCVV